jgi:hypothetical protein
MRLILLAIAVVVASSLQFPIVAWASAGHPVAPAPNVAVAAAVEL